MNFKNWLENQTQVNKLAIFDFDGTLANTPMKPPEWKPSEYVAPDGKIRKGDSSWWVHPDSLQQYDFNQMVLDEFRKARSDPQTKAVLLTGRTGMRTAHLIRGKLRQKGLYGKRQISDKYEKALDRHHSWPNGPHPEDEMPYTHDEFFSGDMTKEDDYPKTPKGNPLGDTLSHKKYVVERKLMHDGIRVVDFWDDRYDHYDEFQNFFKKLLDDWPNLEIINYHYIDNGVKKTIPITK
jgi:hypothetical protein